MVRRAAVAGGLAAALCIGAEPATAQFVPQWQGLYAGVIAGYARSEASIHSSDLAAAGVTNPRSISGLAANGNAFGLAGGFNWQSGLLVFGFEGDWSRYALRSRRSFSGTIPPFGPVSGSLGAELNWMATARARAGIAAGRALIYGTAGLGVARTTGELLISGLGSPITLSDDVLLGGWVAGAGIETMLTPNWSLKAELLHMLVTDDLFSFSINRVPLSSRMDVMTVRGGILFRF